MKKLFVYLCFLNFLYLNAQVNLDSNLTACYALNGNAFDPINSLNGFLSNVSPAADRFNNNNKALSFDEFTASLVELPNSILLKPKAISFSAWVKPGVGFGAERYVLMAPTNSLGISMAAYSLFLNDFGSGINFVVEKCNGSNVDFVYTSNIALNSWYHVAFTADSTSLNIYLNGVFQQSVTSAMNLAYGSNKKVYLGGTGEAVNPAPFAGLIDNVRFYDRVISAAEVSQLYLNDPSCVTALASPIASFSIAVPHCLGTQIQFTDLSSNNPDTWIWQAPGAIVTNSLDPNPIFTFTSVGIHTVNLSCSNSLGTSTSSLTLTINPLPTITVVPSSTLLCRYMTYTINAFGAQNYSWTSQNSGSTLLNTGSSYVFTALNTNTYIVLGSDSVGCESSASRKLNTVICEVWGINEDEKVNLKYDLFPNPVESFVTIKLAEGKIEEFVLRDLFGKTILQEKGLEEKELTINLEGLSKGMYFLQIFNGTKSGIIKLVKE